MKNCPTSNVNRSKLWGFEVSQIIAAFVALTVSNIGLSAFGGPIILSWVIGGGVLAILRLISVGQKDGHLELTVRFIFEPHLFLGHSERRISDDQIFAY
jgi:hypothetical protein